MGGGIATGAAIAGTAVATVAAGPVIVIGAGVVAGATGVGLAARAMYRLFF